MWNPTAPLPATPNGVHFSSTVCLVGAHGGAGTSSWAQVLGFEDCGRTWPVPQDGYPSVFVVARLDMNGLKVCLAALRVFFLFLMLLVSLHATYFARVRLLGVRFLRRSASRG